MSLDSDFVSKYRERVGELLQARQKLRAMGELLPDGTTFLDNASTAFAGTNSDLTKTDIIAAKTLLTSLDGAIDGTAQLVLVKVAGTAGLPK